MLQMWTNDVDYVIAETEDEAKEIMKTKIYPTDPYMHEEIDECDWGCLDSEDDFIFREDDGTDTTKTVAEFIRINGRGYFACSEY